MLSLFRRNTVSIEFVAAGSAVKSNSLTEPPESTGLLVTDQLAKALDECKSKVAHIAKSCKAQNRKFRDIEFDLENDRERCLHGLESSDDFSPSDVQRVTQIFDDPKFFVDGANSNNVIQGNLGDCWFLSALATMSTAKGLVESFCVARDEQVGVYGFIFFRDTAWVTVIIDDLLYTSIPKYEELSRAEKQLYHNDKDKFNASARKGGKILYFARSGTKGETWVPLIEKAYAKLHGDYAALDGGEAGEAIEDLTGGVTTFFAAKDILDCDTFWEEELLKANKDRLFGCAFDGLDSSRSGVQGATVNGLFGDHAYSVLRAVEYNKKRFVIIRNPWGESEWNGRWSDGSKEWTPQWLPALSALGHSFGDDGQFVMEYDDFLATWEQIDRTLLFDSSWVLSSHWLEVTPRPLPAAWSFGDVSFTITLPAPTTAIIVLARLDDRFFRGIAGRFLWTADFVVFRRGDPTPVGVSPHSPFVARSVNLELTLAAGEYIVHVRIDRWPRPGPETKYSEAFKGKERKLAHVLAERAKSRSIAANFQTDKEVANLPIALEKLAGLDLAELERNARGAAGEAGEAGVASEEVATTTTTTTTTTITTTVKSASGTAAHVIPVGSPAAQRVEPTVADKASARNGSKGRSARDPPPPDQDDKDQDDKRDGDDSKNGAAEDGASSPDVAKDDTSNSVFLGLSVYTHKSAPAVVGGQLKSVTPKVKDL